MLAKGKRLKIELWGVRGSLPAPRAPQSQRDHIVSILKRAQKEKIKTPQQLKKFVNSLESWELYGYGGHTSCVELTSKKAHVIVDGGSGLRALGEKLLHIGEQKEFHIILTHFHWDHLIGIPFFTPIFMSGYTLHFYAVQPELETAIRAKFEKPFFPVPYEELKSKIFFHKLDARRPHEFGDMIITPYLLDHPDPCYGLRVECEGKVYGHVIDTECIRTTREELGEDLPLYQNVDLMLFDAQYTLKEAAEKVHWGHASAIIGLEVGMRENIKHMLFVHHDPSASDKRIHLAEEEAGRAFESSKRISKMQGVKIPKIKWSFAREGLVIQL